MGGWPLIQQLKNIERHDGFTVQAHQHSEQSLKRVEIAEKAGNTANGTRNRFEDVAKSIANTAKKLT